MPRNCVWCLTACGGDSNETTELDGEAAAKGALRRHQRVRLGLVPLLPTKGDTPPVNKKDALIRRANPSDVEALIELSLRTIRARYSSFLGETAVEAFISSGAAERFVRETIDRALVVTIDGEVAGCAVGAGHHIDQLLIDERWHRQGLGTLLLARLEENLFKEHDALELDSCRDNDQANAFYRKHGWRETGAYRDEEHGAEMVTLRKGAT